MKNLTWIVVVIAVLIGLFFLFKSSGSQIEPAFEAGVLHPLDHTKGNASSTVVLMEYSDFQCPACKTYYPVVREVMQAYGSQITFVYRHFPLTSIHPNAEFAARAAEAAGKQGKFWEMHDLLFEKQGEWEKTPDVETLFINYANLLGISNEQFRVDWRSKEIKDFVSAHRLHALRAGLQGTPTFFLHGKKIISPKSAEEFKELIRKTLAGE